jgi:IPT/TIG domain
VPGAAGAQGNTISALDLSGNVISTQFAGSEPNVLALSGDSQFLYAGIDGAARVQRFALPDVTLDVHYQLGNAFFGLPTALDLQVAPGAPNTSAVLTSGFNPSGKLTVFDDAIPRASVFTNAGPIQWGTDASTLFSFSSLNQDLLTLLVDASGITLNHDFPSFLTGRRIHFDATTGRIYGENGAVLDPATGLPVATFKSSGLMVVDSQLNAAYFLEQPFNGSAIIDAFDLTHFVKSGSITIPGVNGTAGRLVRWGENGLAFNTSDGHIFLVGGNFISPVSTTIPPATPLPTPPAPVAPGATTPIISSLSPGSAVAGGADMVLTVKGTHFTVSSVVKFNGISLTTTFISASQLSATIPAAAIASGGAAQVVVVDPNGTSNPSSFFVGAATGTGTGGTSFAFTTIPQSSNNLIFDPVHQVFFISVPSTASSLGNTVTVLDLSGNAISSQFAGSEPGALGVSDDGLFLYAGINGSGRAQRYSLPSFNPDINYSLGTPTQFGPAAALDLQVEPGAAHTAAFATGSATSSFFTQGVVVFDDAVARTNRAGTLASSIQWGAGNTTLLGADSFGSDLLVMPVDTNGVTALHDFFPFTQSTRVHFNAATGFAYGNDGHVADPATGTVVGSFAVGPPSVTNLMIPDSSLGKAFFLTQTQTAGNTTVTLQSFNLTSFALLNSMTIPNLKGTVQSLVRWGQNGLAFNTDQGQIVLLGGSFVN